MEVKISLIICLLFVTLSLTLKPENDKADGTQSSTDEISSNLNQFSFKLHNVLTEKRNKNNLFYSPLSVATALAMIYAGTAGETKNEISNAMGWNSTDDVQSLFGDLFNEYVARSSKMSSLSVASRIWTEKGMGLQPRFRQTLQKVFHSKVGKGMFEKDPEFSRKKINDWVKQQTGNKIHNFFKPGTIDSMTRLVLVNAIYFKGKWKTPFDVYQTRKRKFYIESGKSVRTDMMAGMMETRSASGENFTALELPYKGKKFSMVIVLPDRSTNLRDLEKTFNTETLRSTEFFEGKTNVVLPKFKLRSSLDLQNPLTALNIKSLFGPNCDLSEMFKESNGIFVTQAFHKALVEVDEKGTKAAAATGLVTGRTFLPVFNVNRPFLFFIKDRRSDVILFTGRFVKP